MTIPAIFREYIWLVNTIRRARKITLAEINRRWKETEMSGGMEMARSTFNRHKDAIEDIFGIYIACDKRCGYQYYIGNDDVLREDSVQNWMLSTLSVNNIISESLPLQDRILLQPVPTEGDYLMMVIEAMKKNVKIAVEYRKYGAETPKQLTLEPYCIKMFKQHWYVLGHFHRDATEEKPDSDYFGLFSFDRIIGMTLTDDRFQIDPEFDAQAYFAECYGVLVGDGTPTERIVLRAFDQERYYMRDLPLHKSQREIGQGDNYADFEFRMRPTSDFSGHILSRGAFIKVLSPQWLANKIHDMHLDAVRLYESDEEGVGLAK